MGGVLQSFNQPPNPWDEFGPNSWVSPVMPFNSQDQQYNNDLATVDQATQNAFNGQHETHTYTDQNGIQHTTYSADGKNYNVYTNQNGDRVVQVTTSQGGARILGQLPDGPQTTTYTLDPNGNLQVQQNNGFFGGQTNTDFQREPNPWCGGQDPYGQDPWDQVTETQTQDPPINFQPLDGGGMQPLLTDGGSQILGPQIAFNNFNAALGQQNFPQEQV